ncbi:MAG: hypothetical protein ACXWHB_01710 [Usitatibacter sp.]
MIASRGAVVLAVAALAAIQALAADDAAADEKAIEHPFKLTIGVYNYSDRTRGVDTNLRHTSGLGNVWIGYYREDDGAVEQWRGGWDRAFGDAIRVTPSLQAASGGFVGGSVTAETGEPWFFGAGFGRTNLRPYVNLNFDPNDSYAVSAGRRGEGGEVAMVQMVRDNREHPDQRHFHFLYRRPLEGGERLTLDALYKVGLVDEALIRRWGFTLTYDWPRVFVRIARDPNTNFTAVDAWRLSLGARF